MTRQRRLCAACDRVLPLWARADKRACNGTCRMRVSRMRRGARSPLSPRSYRVRQPIPRKHQSPALLRIAGVQHARAEQAEQQRRDWQQRYEEQAAELEELRRELADQKRTATEQERRQSEETKRLREELSDQQDDSQAELADAQQQISQPTGDGEERRMAALLDGPTIELCRRIVHSDYNGFQATLIQALQFHGMYWSHDAESRNAPMGALALGPLAMACLAHDHGVDITVRSDYLPQRLIVGGSDSE